MFKRIVLYCALAALIFVGADKALRSDTQSFIIPISVTIPARPMTFTVDDSPATFTGIIYGDPANWLTEDAGLLSHAIYADPGDGFTAQMYTTVGILSGPGGPLPATERWTINADGFYAPIIGRLLTEDIMDVAVISITEPSNANFNLTFFYDPAVLPAGELSGALTLTLSTI